MHMIIAWHTIKAEYYWIQLYTGNKDVHLENMK